MEERLSILLCEDDENLGMLLREYLQAKGYNAELYPDGEAGYKAFLKNKYDICVFDVMMPKKDGFTLAQEVRAANSEVPIIFLTGKGSEDDKIQGLITGGDDYIVKPYSLRELTARIQVILRRSGNITKPADSNTLTIRNLTIDKLAHKVSYKGEDLGLANREYEVLLYFATHPDKEITFEELGNAIFGSYQDADRRSIMVNVSRLRKKMAIDFELENMLETVWSKGYKFITK